MLIDCNQQQSIEVASENTTSNSMWTNKVSEGLVLNPGDRVSVSSAFINEVGSGDDSIQFTVDNNSATISFEFFKCADGENCLILPRKFCWQVLRDSTTADAADEANCRPGGGFPEAAGSKYTALFHRQQDGKRYTLMNRNFGAGEYGLTHGRPYFTRRIETLSLKLDPGYHTADTICEQLTKQLHGGGAVEQVPRSLRIESPLYHTFDCANADNYAFGKYKAMSPTNNNEDKWNAYAVVGILDPELYVAGHACEDTVIIIKQGDVLITNWDYDTQIDKLKALFDAQAHRSDLIFGTGISTSNARFLHIDRADNMTKFGSDDDLNKCTGRVFVAYDADSYGIRNVGGKVAFTLTGDKIHGGLTPVLSQYSPGQVRRIGFDTHFSAYGVDGLLLWSGYTNTGSEIQSIYAGAIDPSVSYDTDASRFTISQLHTGRKEINTESAGQPAGKDATKNPEQPLNPNAGTDIYQINPIYNQKNAAFRNVAYNPEVRLAAYEGAAPSNNLLSLWHVFDSKSGVFVTDWGFTEEQWDGCMWRKLGFEYSDMNRTAVNRQAQDGLSYPMTTNADVNGTQLMNWPVNPYGAAQYTLQLPQLPAASVSTITVDATSTSIMASHLARQQADGYWLIRSSLIENSAFMDSQGLSPVIAVVDKSYSASDYIYLGDSTVDFMVTAQRTITSITTSLHLPDGTLAGVNDRNSVIYRIVKPNLAPTSILDSFLPPQKNAPK